MFEILYHPAVKKDIGQIGPAEKRRIKQVIETKLAVNPAHYGERLKHDMKGFWKLRAGDYRIVFSLTERTVSIFGIMHRREIYDIITKRQKK